MPSKRTVTLLAVVAAFALVATTATAASNANQTCTASSANPLASLNYTDPNIEGCVRARCVSTLGTVPTVRTGGYCNGDATSESKVECQTLYDAYNEYYACVMRALQWSTDSAVATTTAEVTKFMNTPGFPYHLSPLGCEACNHFRETVFPTLASSCDTWACSSISSQNPASLWYGVPGHGYNHQLCGTGCIAAMLLTIPFAIVSAFVFIACGCCWPSPSLKTTYAQVQKDEEAEKNRVRSDDEDDEEDHRFEPVEGVDNNIAHEPVLADNNRNQPDEDVRPDEYVNLR